MADGVYTQPPACLYYSTLSPYATLTRSYSKHPKLHPCPSSSPLAFGYQLSPTCAADGWPSSNLPSEGCRQAHVRPQSAAAAAAKISTAALEETLRQDPEAGLGLDHFTRKIMYFSKGSPSRGGDAHCYGFPSSITVIYLCIRRQECTKTGYSL